MKLAPLHSRFIEELSKDLNDWKFIAGNRQFRKKRPDQNFFVHVAFINHLNDFDATIDVAVEFVAGKERVCIVGAELGNIEGVGQVRHTVSSEQSAVSAAREAIAHLKKVGFPFFERYGNPHNVTAALKAGGEVARLISPLTQSHSQQITALERVINAG